MSDRPPPARPRAQRHSRPRPRPRRGLTSVVMLIGLLILTIIAASLVRVERTRLDQARSQERLLQAEALADAGVDRAIAHLRSQADFPGETWEPTADDLGEGGRRARVVTTVQPDRAGPPGSRVIAVAAELILTPHPTIRQSRTVVWQPNPPAP